MTRQQKDLYDLTVKGGLRKHLIEQGMKDSTVVQDGSDSPKTRRSKAAGKRRGTKYNEDVEDDDKYFARLADGLNDSGDKEAAELSREQQLKQASTSSDHSVEI